jgi:hypothetical protein
MINLNEFHGRIHDLDTHIQPSPKNYEIAAGEFGRLTANKYAELIKILPKDEADKIIARSGNEFSDYNDETVWRTKGAAAPGAFNAENRLKTLDYMGVDRSFMFSDPGIQTTAFADDALGLATMRHWNDFIINTSNTDPNRLRGVAIINTHDVAVAAQEVSRVLKAGGRAFVIACSVAPGNASPAHPAMDLIWAMIQEAGATVMIHLGGGRSVGDEFDFIKNPNWDKGLSHLAQQPQLLEVLNLLARLLLYFFGHAVEVVRSAAAAAAAAIAAAIAAADAPIAAAAAAAAAAGAAGTVSDRQ